MSNRSHTKTTFLTLAAALLLSPLVAPAAEDKPAANPAPAIELGSLLGDHAVLQREMEVPVWGWSKPDAHVSVEFGGQKKSATAGKDGKRGVKLESIETATESPTVVDLKEFIEKASAGGEGSTDTKKAKP